MNGRFLGRLAAAVFIISALAACGGGRSGDVVGPQQITGIALPEGYSINRGETIVLGEGDRWTGRLVYEINSSAGDMFDFVRRQMPVFGWSEVSVVRAHTSTLTFSSPGTGRVATVNITPRQLPPWGSVVSTVVSPIGGAAPAPAAPQSYSSPPRSEAPQPAPPAVPRGEVSAQPLR
jgi:hypothetical protein